MFHNRNFGIKLRCNVFFYKLVKLSLEMGITSANSFHVSTESVAKEIIEPICCMATLDVTIKNSFM